MLRNISCIVLIVVIITSVSCRKGEEDPFLSLRSRNNRITGEWVLSKLVQDIKNESTDSYDLELLFDYTNYGGGRIAKKYSTSSYYTTFNCFDVSLNISDNGTTSFTYYFENSQLGWRLRKTTTGTWSWNNSEGKKKEYVNISDLNIFFADIIKYCSDNYSMYLFCDFNFECLKDKADFRIIRLSDDELKISLEKDVLCDNVPYSFKTEMFFSKK